MLARRATGDEKISITDAFPSENYLSAFEASRRRPREMTFSLGVFRQLRKLIGDLHKLLLFEATGTGVSGQSRQEGCGGRKMECPTDFTGRVQLRITDLCLRQLLFFQVDAMVLT